jgi:hypothetical protein
VSLENRHLALYDKYRGRPARSGVAGAGAATQASGSR